MQVFANYLLAHIFVLEYSVMHTTKLGARQPLIMRE